MSNLIPPLLSSSPPPIVGPLDEEDDDEFGDFRAAADPFDCDDLSMPPSPEKSPEKEAKSDFHKVSLDINSNKNENIDLPTHKLNELLVKDYQDKRKSIDDDQVALNLDETVVSCGDSQSNIFDFCETENINEDQNTSKATDELASAHCDQSNQPDNGFLDLQNPEPSSLRENDEIEDNNVFTSVLTDQVPDHKDFSNDEDISERLHCSQTQSDELPETLEVNDIKFDIDFGEDKPNDNSSKELNLENPESSLSLKACESDSKLSDDEFGDFEDHCTNEPDTIPEQQEETVTSEDDFDDFVSPFPTGSQQELPDEDFADFKSPEFSDFTTNNEKSVKLEIDKKNAFSHSEIILKEIFPPIGEVIEDCDYVNATIGNRIFEELKDVTETHALLYQWSKSSSQKMFLKALNIDLRNILYGPTWNSSLPRFAANLGLTPLEPVKTEILTPTPVENVSNPSSSSQKSMGDIPTAQFDWNGSGLINPLDYSQTMLLDLEQLVASLDIPSTTTNPNYNSSPSPSHDLLDEWDLWLQSTTNELPRSVPEDCSQSDQVKDEFFPTSSDKSDPLPTFHESGSLHKGSNVYATNAEGPSSFAFQKPSEGFSPFHSSQMIVPLRETRISNENLDDCAAKPGWLEPTIVTPDLPRKATVVNSEGEDDEFDDFQMVLPASNEQKLNDICVKSEADMTNQTISKTLHNQEHISGIQKLQPDVFMNGSIDASTQPKGFSVLNDEDDEFTDFHSSLPPAKSENNDLRSSLSTRAEIITPLQPVPIEPLKPSVQYTQPVSTQINWPDPGVTDEDIQNITLTYSRKTELPPLTNDLARQSTSKENDDDDWSDFVSVKTPIKSVLPERTSTPDLPLSVLNLNNVQAPKQPIPVITPSGLIQTKLSTNPLLQPKLSNVVQTTLHQPNMFKPPPVQSQPSIVSNQFRINLFQSTSNEPTSTLKANQEDDDDWTDFVSSQPTPQVNGYQQKLAVNHAKTPHVNWTSATTNIIMNPTHFESFQTYVPQQSKKVAARSSTPSSSAMPDLDFIAPKNRTKK